MSKVEKQVILSNQVVCLKCGTRPFSANRHDFRYCKCRAVAVDGGTEYLRRLWTGGPAEEVFSELSVSWPESDYEQMVELFKPLWPAERAFTLAKAYAAVRGLPRELLDPLLRAVEWAATSRRNVHGLVCAFVRVERDGEWLN